MKNSQTAKQKCKYCCEELNAGARICSRCGSSQNKLLWYAEKYSVILGTVLSLFFLILGIVQYKEAQIERIKAEDALSKAKKVEDEIKTTGKALGKVLLALSTMDGTVLTFDVMKFFPDLMETSASSLFEAIELKNNEIQEMYKVKKLITEWLVLYKKHLENDHDKPLSPELERIEEEIKVLVKR